MRRAFSVRRHPAAPGKGDGYYWRIHDMDGDSDHGNVDNAVAEQRDEEKVEKKFTVSDGEARSEDDRGAGRKLRHKVVFAPASSGGVVVRRRSARCGGSSCSVEKTVWGKVRRVTPWGPRTPIYRRGSDRGLQIKCAHNFVAVAK